MDRKKHNKSGQNWSQTRVTASVLTIAVTLSACSAPKTVVTAVSAIGGTAASVGGAVVSGATSTVKGAASLASGAGNTAATAARTPPQIGGAGALDPTIPATLAAGSSIPQTTEPTDPTGNAQASEISKGIIAGLLYCVRLEKEEYRIDCYADQLDQVAQNMPDDPEFGQTRSILSDTASKLSQVVENRASTSLRPVTLSSGDGSNRGSSRTVKAVETAQLSAAYAEAEKILEEAETLLLRASEASSRRKLAYAQVAETVGSTKVLLRST